MLDKKDVSDTLLTFREVQEIFRRGKRQRYELLPIRGFPTMKLGGKHLVSAKALDNWIQKNAGKRISKVQQKWAAFKHARFCCHFYILHPKISVKNLFTMKTG